MIPSHAEIVIVGAGILGSAIAYRLARMGKKDVLVLDKFEPAMGTTIQSAGLVGQRHGTPTQLYATLRSVEVFNELENAGYRTGWNKVGSLRIALAPERDAEFSKLLQIAKEAEYPADYMSTLEAEARFPDLKLGGVRQMLWYDSDGYISPKLLNDAYLCGAQRYGIQVCTGITVQSINEHHGNITDIQTDYGMIACETLIIAAGAFSAKLVQSIGIEIPAIPVRHTHTLFSHPSPTLPHAPILRFPDYRAYLSPTSGGFVVGGFENKPYSLNPLDISDDFALPYIPTATSPDHYYNQVKTFIKESKKARLVHAGKGLPTFTPDGDSLLGKVPQIHGLIIATGCNAQGISTSATVADAVAEIITKKKVPSHLQHLSPTRFQPFSWEYAQQQATQVYANYFTVS